MTAAAQELAPAAPARRGLSPRARRILITAIGAVGALAVALAAYIWWDTDHNVRTDNAVVAGSVVSVFSPASGTLRSWDAVVGQTVSAGMPLGAMRLEGAGGLQFTFAEIRAPIDGVVVQSNAVVGQQVFPGTGGPLAVIADTANAWIVANVNEGDVHRLHVGQPVDVTVDAVPGTTLTGMVEALTDATQSTFSVFPALNANGAFTKVTQVVPVRIRLAPHSSRLAVGESASVTIHVK